jgi:hypothetical protein
MTSSREQETGTNPPSLPITLKERDAIRDRIASLIVSARREIIVFAPQMDAHFFNNSQLTRPLASFAARHQNNRARFLIEDASQVLRDNDRVVALCRRLPEFIQLHQVGEEHLGFREMFIIVDGASYLHQPDVTEYACIVEPSGRRRAVEMLQRFEQMWDRSEPAVGLNTAGLA